ncbi:LemA family protein, partial [Candidatus Bathyarchaeota archaeon]
MADLILGWSLVVYNSLVNLRNVVDQAWSMIDIQLKRRSDLIPNLVEILEGYRKYEEETQIQTATLRSQTLNQENPIGVTSLLQSVAEAYPELKAGRQFLEL